MGRRAVTASSLMPWVMWLRMMAGRGMRTGTLRCSRRLWGFAAALGARGWRWSRRTTRHTRFTGPTWWRTCRRATARASSATPRWATPSRRRRRRARGRGAYIGFGNTAAAFTEKAVGLKQRGTADHGDFLPDSGRRYVPARDGDYAQALGHEVACAHLRDLRRL